MKKKYVKPTFTEIQTACMANDILVTSSSVIDIDVEKELFGND